MSFSVFLGHEFDIVGILARVGWSVCVCVRARARACVPACMRVCASVDAMKKLVPSFILSRLDYCNSLLAGHPENNWLDHLQRVQNNAAHLVLGRQGRDHATPLLRSLHWFPVCARIEYKISTLC